MSLLSYYECTVIFLDSVASEGANALWAGPLTSPKTCVALMSATVLELCIKQSFIQPHYFLCLKATCEIHIGLVNVYVQYLCDK